MIIPMSCDRMPMSRLMPYRVADLGINLPRVLKRAGLHPSRFRLPQPILETQEFIAFFRAVEELSGSGTGLRLASNVLPHQLDIASLAALHASNFGEALKALTRYAPLVYAGKLEIALTEDEVRIGYRPPDGQTFPSSLVDYVFASAVAIARRGSGNRIAPRLIELARHRTDELALKSHFRCEIDFEAPLDALVFDRRSLEQPFVMQNEDLTTALSFALETALSRCHPSNTVADDTKAILRNHMRGEHPSVEKVATEMHMSSRTLQRRLEKLGTNYQRLLEEVRRETARSLLSDTDLDVGEIALELGFDEVNSFSRAFYGWEHITPTRWRALQQPSNPGVYTAAM